MDTVTNTGKLFIISGPSGAGKGTLCKLLQAGTNIELSVSMTTRKPRKGETEGKSYFFVTEEEFEKEIKRNGFLEYAQVYGNYYGTPKEKVMEKLRQGTDVILEIDIQGALQVKENYPEGILIFILPPSMKELRKRITGRGTETDESIGLRLSETLNEISYIGRYDYYIVNREVNAAAAKIEAIFAAEHSRVPRDIYSLIRRYKEEN